VTVTGGGGSDGRGASGSKLFQRFNTLLYKFFCEQALAIGFTLTILHVVQFSSLHNSLNPKSNTIHSSCTCS
jgi:hypothetical protein